MIPDCLAIDCMQYTSDNRIIAGKVCLSQISRTLGNELARRNNRTALSLHLDNDGCRLSYTGVRILKHMIQVLGTLPAAFIRSLGTDTDSNRYRERNGPPVPGDEKVLESDERR